MNPQTFIFLGRSGCGKGTQARKIEKYLKTEDKNRDVLYLEMGDLFRNFWKKENYTNSISKKLMEKGDLQPAFLQIYLWTNYLLDNLKENEHLIVDGTPRRVTDAEAMDSAFKFYGRTRPNFIFLDVSREWAKKRILERVKAQGREEDFDEEVIDSRLDWYDEFVEPSINFFRDDPFYNFVEINGEQSIEEVHQEILLETNLKY